MPSPDSEAIGLDSFSPRAIMEQSTNKRKARPMSPSDSSERMAFLRREIARIEASGRDSAVRLPHARDPAARASPTRSLENRAVPTCLATAQLIAGLHEIVPAAAPDACAALGFALCLAAACAREKPAAGFILAVEDFVALETGAPYGPGLAAAGVDPARLAIVRTHSPQETLRVMEEALKCRGVAAVLGESALTQRQYGLDASRRLALAARAGAGAGFLVPVALAGAGARLSSAAATRVEVFRRSSAIEMFGQNRLGLPGPPVAGLRILKARGAFEIDSDRVHEVAFHAFSFHPPAVAGDRPDFSHESRAALSA
jgi:protein ImuA